MSHNGQLIQPKKITMVLPGGIAVEAFADPRAAPSHGAALEAAKLLLLAEYHERLANIEKACQDSLVPLRAAVEQLADLSPSAAQTLSRSAASSEAAIAAVLEAIPKPPQLDLPGDDTGD